ncbi:MAG: L-lactate dehydrogenase [Patescibacteria group bacterium]
MAKCTFKVSIVGGGHVGVTAAYALLLDGLATDIVLVSRDVNKLIGEQLDLEHSIPFLQSTEITATDDYGLIAGSQFVVVTAGVAQQVGETRLDLVQKNLAIIEEIIPKIVAAAPLATIVIVANPVDILTYRAVELARLPEGQVFGTGTMLDTARFRFHLSELLNVSARSIHAYILGEHGESSFPVLSSASVGGQLLSTFPEYSPEKAMQAFQSARSAAAKIIEAKGSTYYAIATVIRKISHVIFNDAKTVLPASVPVQDFYGVSQVSLSIPCIIGARGVERQLRLSLNESEQDNLRKSADVLKKYL